MSDVRLELVDRCDQQVCKQAAEKRRSEPTMCSNSSPTFSPVLPQHPQHTHAIYPDTQEQRIMEHMENR